MSHVDASRRLPSAISGIALAFAACSSTQGSPSGAASQSQAGVIGTRTTVEVELQEWAVLPAIDSVAAGNVEFQVTNMGPKYPHEFVVLKTDVHPSALPLSGPGMVDRFDSEIVVIGESEDIALGANQAIEVSLTAGMYVLVCNIVDEHGPHYKLGMRTAFTVTD